MAVSIKIARIEPLDQNSLGITIDVDGIDDPVKLMLLQTMYEAYKDKPVNPLQVILLLYAILAKVN